MPASAKGSASGPPASGTNVHVELVARQPGGQQRQLLFGSERSSVGMMCRMRASRGNTVTCLHAPHVRPNGTCQDGTLNEPGLSLALPVSYSRGLPSCERT